MTPATLCCGTTLRIWPMVSDVTCDGTAPDRRAAAPRGPDRMRPLGPQLHARRRLESVGGPPGGRRAVALRGCSSGRLHHRLRRDADQLTGAAGPETCAGGRRPRVAMQSPPCTPWLCPLGVGLDVALVGSGGATPESTQALTPLRRPDGRQMIPAHPGGQFTPVVHIVPEHMKDDLLSCVRPEDLALLFTHGGRWVKHMPEVGHGPAAQCSLDHAPRGLKPSDQLGGRVHRLPLLLLLPVHEGGHIRTALAHPQLEPPNAIVEDVLDEHPNRPVCTFHGQRQLLGRERRHGREQVALKAVPALVDDGQGKCVLGGHGFSHGCRTSRDERSADVTGHRYLLIGLVTSGKTSQFFLDVRGALGTICLSETCTPQYTLLRAHRPLLGSGGPGRGAAARDGRSSPCATCHSTPEHPCRGSQLARRIPDPGVRVMVQVETGWRGEDMRRGSL